MMISHEFLFAFVSRQIGEEINGMMMVRSADNRQGVCPAKYLQDVWQPEDPKLDRDRDKRSATTSKPTPTTTMKKSSSFSFSQVASTAATSKNLNFSMVSAAAASSKGKKSNLTRPASHYHKEDKKGAANMDKSYKQWEEFREKKLESMKTHKQNVERRQKTEDTSLIKYNHQETIQPPQIKPRNLTQHKLTRHQREREALREHARYQHRRKISLDPNWYTDNIYSNQSYDDSDCDSVKRPLTTSASFSHYSTRSNRYNAHKNNFHRYDFNGNNRTNNININISNTANTKLHGHSSSFEDESYDVNSPYFERHRNYPKSHSCSFAERHRREPDVEVMPDARSRSVPKSHSFSTNRNVMRQYDMDLIEYQRYKRMMAQRYRDMGPSAPNEPPFVRRICDREGCFSETCLVKNVNNSQNISINNNIVNNNNMNTTRIINEWDLRNKNSAYRDEDDGHRRFPRETLIDDIDTFDDDDFIFNDGFSFQEFPCQPSRPSRQRPHRNPYFSSMRFANFSDHFHRRNRIHDRDLDDLFRRERSKILIRNKFDKLNKYSDDFVDDYQKSFEDLFAESKTNPHGHNLKPSKTMLEVKPPDKYDDTESDSTDLDLDDFNLDFEKYWEELEDKNLSTSSTLELAEQNDIFDTNNNHIDAKRSIASDANNNPISFINDFYKPTKYSPLNSKQHDYFQKILPPKKMNIPSTARPLGLVTPHDDYMISMKRPLTINNIIESPLGTPPISDSYYHDDNMERAKFQIIPNKTGLKISPLYNFERDNFHNNVNSINNVFYENCNNIINKGKNKLKSTARPLLFWWLLLSAAKGILWDSSKSFNLFDSVHGVRREKEKIILKCIINYVIFCVYMSRCNYVLRRAKHLSRVSLIVCDFI